MNKAIEDTIESVIKTINIPKRTKVAYKFFYLKDGKLYPPMVKNPNGAATPTGVWIDANAPKKAGTTKTGRPQVEKGGKGTHCSPGYLAYRPGWHLGEIPIALQFSKSNTENENKKELFPAEFVWAECEYAADIDYQEKAMANGYTKNGSFRHSYAGLKELPVNGFYKYRTNPDPKTEEWVITGSIKINRILTNKEIDEICIKAGRTPQKREKGSFGEIEETFIESMKKEYKSTGDMDKSFSNAISKFSIDDNIKLDSIMKARLGESYSRGELLNYLSTQVKGIEKKLQKTKTINFERGE